MKATSNHDPLIKGLVGFLVTPMDALGEVDHRRLGELVDRTVTAGAHALAPLGSVGEYPYLTSTERHAVVRTVVDATAARVPVIANVSAMASKEAVLNAQEAIAAGADALLLNQQSYFPVTPSGVAEHIAAVMDGVARDVQVYFYNQPIAGGDVSAATLIDLAQRFGLSGMKDASGDLGRIPQIRAALGDHFAVINGFESLGHVAMLLGADGWTTSLLPVVPDAIAAVYRHAAQGDWTQAQASYLKISELMAFAHRYQPLPVVIKTALRLAGFDAGPPRAPLPELPASAVDQLAHLISDLT